MRAALAAALLEAVGAALWVYGPHTYPAGQAADLAARLGAVADPAERVRLRPAIAQYQTDSQVKIWTTLVQAAGGYFAFRDLKATLAKLDVDRERILGRFRALTGLEHAEGLINVIVRHGGSATCPSDSGRSRPTGSDRSNSSGVASLSTS